MSSKTVEEAAWAEREAIRYLTLWNPRFALYRRQQPDFRQDDVNRLRDALLAGAAHGAAEGVEIITKMLEDQHHDINCPFQNCNACGYQEALMDALARIRQRGEK